MLRGSVLAIPCRAFCTPRRCHPRPASSKSPPSRRHGRMAGEESLHSGYRRGSPRIRDEGTPVHAAKASVRHSDKASPMVIGKTRKEHIKIDLGSGDSPVGSACSTNIGSPELCESSCFDICMPQRVELVKLSPSLLERNRERRKENERAKMSFRNSRLQPGLILLRNYLKHNDQVEIIRLCRRLGVGSGGFYRPGYRDGAKLSLQMMCLGKNWDPQTRLYEDVRPIDGARAPQIPVHFKKLVEEAIQTSHAVIKQDVEECSSVEAELPNMLPDICIVNFYSKNGKLGLHQDRDESEESCMKGLPVVSFSLGDKADFLYGESRDVDKVSKIELGNGDVLIFGGKSRLIYHGISCIHPGTAPSRLIEETNLRPGRLNLTFRQL